jgi:GAF domain-containing protein
MAAVPLRVQDVIVGALVVFQLLTHKPGFVHEDRELFDLIGAHAASALVASRVYAGMARKLRTLEELMSMVKGGG